MKLIVCECCFLLKHGVDDNGVCTVHVCVVVKRLVLCLAQVVNKMVDNLKLIPGISRVLYDLTSKPPGTTEWE